MATTSIPAEEMADYEELCLLATAGKKPDPEMVRRIRERSARVRQAILEKHGIVEIGADIIREMRDAE